MYCVDRGWDTKFHNSSTVINGSINGTSTGNARVPVNNFLTDYLMILIQERLMR